MLPGLVETDASPVTRHPSPVSRHPSPVTPIGALLARWLTEGGIGCGAESKFLTKDTSYRFQVCAFNGAGESPMSQILQIQTRQDG